MEGFGEASSGMKLHITSDGTKLHHMPSTWKAEEDTILPIFFFSCKKHSTWIKSGGIHQTKPAERQSVKQLRHFKTVNIGKDWKSLENAADKGMTGFLVALKSLPANAGDVGLTPESGRSPGEGKGNPLQYSCLENPMTRGTWWAAVHRAAKSRTRWRATYHAHMQRNEKG